MKGGAPPLGPRGLYLRSSPTHGLGVFAAVAREPGALLEVSPVLIVHRRQVSALRQTALYAYYFGWPQQAGAIALGYGSLYNHSYNPTARYDLEVERRAIVFTAIEPIYQNQEITINYNGDPTDMTPLWFDCQEAAPA